MSQVNKKHGRNKAKCNAYKAASTREKNKLRKILRHIRNQAITLLPRDLDVALKKLQAVLPNSEIKAIVRENPRNMAI